MYMCMHMCAQILRVRMLYMWYACEKVVCVCHSCVAVNRRVSNWDHFCVLWTTVHKLVHQFNRRVCTSHASLWPYHRPLRGCPHLQAVTERAWCIGVGRGRPGYIQTLTSCMEQPRRWQPIWGCEKRETQTYRERERKGERKVRMNRYRRRYRRDEKKTVEE